MLTLWGRTNSINVQKVHWCLEELALPYRRIDAGREFGVVDTPEYRRLNPNALVPTIEDDGFVLWESNAIVRYLAAKHAGGGLWPADPRTRADADRWMDWQATTFTPATGPAFHGLIRTAPEKRDTSAIAQSIAKAEPMAALLDAHLAGRRFVAGDAFTAGDIAVGAAAHRWLTCRPRARSAAISSAGTASFSPAPPPRRCLSRRSPERPRAGAGGLALRTRARLRSCPNSIRPGDDHDAACLSRRPLCPRLRGEGRRRRARRRDRA
jgi:glutathione S-transferase